jgi:hypothetical protein
VRANLTLKLIAEFVFWTAYAGLWLWVGFGAGSQNGTVLTALIVLSVLGAAYTIFAMLRRRATMTTLTEGN